jgi:hypothetical protein
MIHHRGAEGTEKIEKIEKINEITEGIIGGAIEVHRALGPGYSSQPTKSVCAGK